MLLGPVKLIGQAEPLPVNLSAMCGGTQGAGKLTSQNMPSPGMDHSVNQRCTFGNSSGRALSYVLDHELENTISAAICTQVGIRLCSIAPMPKRAHRSVQMGMACSDPHPECPNGVEPEEGDVCILVGLENAANLHQNFILT